jgi:hypothetical protein
MQDNDLQSIIDSISEKVGKENSALIADDIGKLITINSSVVDDIKKKDTEISRLTATNEKLVIANGNLLQSIPMGKEEKKEEVKEERKSTSFKDCFDKKGNFIK